jgi:hypothetical protein
MRFNEIKPLLENEQIQQDSPKQFLADVESGAIDPVIANAGMQYLEKVITATQPDAQQANQSDPQQAQKVPGQAPQQQTTQAPKQVPNQQVKKVPGQPLQQVPQQRNIVPASAQMATEDVSYSKQNADQVRKILLKQGASSQEVMDAITFIYRKNIVKNCKELMALKLFKPEGAELLSSLFYELPATFHQRNDLSNVLLKTGVLDLKKFATPHEGNLADLIMPKYQANKAVVNLFLKLKNRKDFPTQVSAANKGAGEDLITIMGNPVQKLSPGDLNIGGKEIEIKAMGARLKGFGGSDIYGNPSPYYATWASLVGESLGSEGTNFMQELGTSLKKYFHFGKANLFALSEALKVSKNPKKKELLVEAFDGLMQVLYPLSDTKMRNRILQSFDNKGFDVEILRKNWFLFSYDYYTYSTADKKTGSKMHAIMFMNQGDDTYQIVTDSDQISNNWDKYELGSDLFNWKNPTGAAPKITYGKEKRAKRVTNTKVNTKVTNQVPANNIQKRVK